MNPIPPTKSGEPVKCPYCGSEMELFTFESYIKRTDYDGLEPLWLCSHTPLCLRHRLKTIRDALRCQEPR